MFSLLVPPTGTKEYLRIWFTIWPGLSSASSKTIRGSALCKNKKKHSLNATSKLKTFINISDNRFVASLQEYPVCPLPAAWSQAAGSEEGSREEGNRSCGPRSSERLCRTQRKWELHLYPHHSTPLKNESTQWNTSAEPESGAVDLQTIIIIPVNVSS